MEHHCLIITGPMASGKTTLAKALEKEKGYKRIVTYTTRPIREGEVDGVDYHFITEEDFQQRVKSNFFAEWTSYDASFGHCCYGSALDDYIYKEGKSVVVLNPIGVMSVVNRFDDMGRNLLKSDRPFVLWLDLPQEVTMLRALKRGDSVEEVYRRHKTDAIDFSVLKMGSFADVRFKNEHPVDELVMLTEMFMNED